MNTAVLMFSACFVGADPTVVPAGGHAASGDCCGKAVVVNDCGCAPKCGCGFFSHLKSKFCSPCAKPACDVCPKPAPVCHTCPKPACNACEKAHPTCDTCAPKKSCGLFHCFNLHINLCHSCAKSTSDKCDKCGTAVIVPTTPGPAPVPVAPVPGPKPEGGPKTMPKVGTNYNPVRPDAQPVSAPGKIIIDVVPQN